MRFLGAALLAGSLAAGQAGALEKPAVKRLNPAALSKPNGYSHVVEASGGRAIYVSGQVALDAQGAVVGQANLEAQTRQVFENLKTALAAAGATLDDVVKITVFMTDVSELATFRKVRDLYFTGPPPASTLVQIERLARPELMIEIEAVAVAQ